MGDAPDEVELFSPAIISLFTRLLSVDRDGSSMQSASLLQTVDLGDTLRLTKLDAGESDRSVQLELSLVDDAAAGQPPDTEAVVQALALFNAKIAERGAQSTDDAIEFQPACFRAELIKRIPAGMGLGDASSNAAAALHGANALCGFPASPKELMEWGAELGGEVASFLAGSGSVYCTGRGGGLRYDSVESVVPLAGLKAGTRYLPLYLILPLDVSLPAAAAVQRLTDEVCGGSGGGGVGRGAGRAKSFAGRSDPDPQTLLVAMGAYEGRWLTPALAETLPPDGQLFMNDLQPYALDESTQLAGTCPKALMTLESMLPASRPRAHRCRQCLWLITPCLTTPFDVRARALSACPFHHVPIAAVQEALLEHGGLTAVLSGDGPAMHAFGALSEATAAGDDGAEGREAAEQFARRLSAKVTDACGTRVRVIHAGFCSPRGDGGKDKEDRRGATAATVSGHWYRAPPRRKIG